MSDSRSGIQDAAFAGDFVLDAREARLRCAARALVRRHRADIERVGAALTASGTMTGGEIDAMLPKGFMARPNIWADVMTAEELS